MESLYQTQSFLTACISLVQEPDKPWSSQWPSCTNSQKELRRCCSAIGRAQSIFCAQSGARIRLTVWKWSGESRYPGAFPSMLENFRRAFSPVRLTTPGSPRMIWNLNIDFAKTSFLGADFIALDACFHTMWTGGYRGRKHLGDGNIVGTGTET